MPQEKWLVDGPQTIDIDSAVRRLKVSLVAGRVDIVGHDEPTTRVEVHSIAGKEIKVSLTDGVLEIDHPQLNWDNWLDVFKSFRGSARVDVSVLVPREVELKFGVVSANALVAGLNGDANVSTVSGDVVVDGINGDLQINSVGGELSVQNHYGVVNAHSISGDITVAGELMRFTGDTVSGDTYLDLDGIPDEVRVNSVSGSVTARLASGTPAQYRMNTVSGRLQLDDATVTGVHGSYTSKYGELSGRWVEVKANTVSGDISVLHAVTA
ncbi:DUF4097 family beta strand repeat-containing protein [Galbitalea sp. SE-J8]|uniref:DUF4097 family beta strand repeat-containing protein n=1 Tax=Galbitalea sp. SE-J8 TaxID=3054952 RepID=UPI00259CC159|nr:DUF4097 family beta strand repeat-containing protein [Galbitalea sp. SE-J8]MDM4762215.1 DUF4097 family beta strand repeat-containing protein [Galbitalea sp. SE-J8]